MVIMRVLQDNDHNFPDRRYIFVIAGNQGRSMVGQFV